MHVLTVVDHPNPKSFSHAVADAFATGVRQAGHSVEIADLHAEQFDPRWTSDDIRANGTNAPSDVAREQDRIARADAICLVFPLFWWGMPAMTKGWVERVWSWGWAYDQLDDPDCSMQRQRTGVLLVPAGARSDEMEEESYTEALETAWIKGTFGYFGLSPRRLELLHGSTGSKSRRTALLQRSFQCGVDLAEPASTG